MSASVNFGFKFYYWPYFKNNEYKDSSPNNGYKKGDFYIHQKYANLKEEMLSSNIQLDLKAVKSCQEKAINLLNTPPARQMKSDDVELAGYCKIKPGTPVDIQNLLSIIFWTSCGFPQGSIKRTFRPHHENETLEEIKNRNAEFWNISKLLMETVEIYGMKISGLGNKLVYSLWSPKILSSLKIYLCAPTSAYRNVDVLQFAVQVIPVDVAPKLAILELREEITFGSLKCFDCSWLSTFPEEQELLFMGGFNPIRISSIQPIRPAYVADPYNTRTPPYSRFVAALNLFEHVLDGKRLEEMTKSNHNYQSSHSGIIPMRLLQHYDTSDKWTNRMPLYINDLFAEHAKTQREIILNLEAIKDGYRWLKGVSYLFDQKIDGSLSLPALNK
eukprot:189731_1